MEQARGIVPPCGVADPEHTFTCQMVKRMFGSGWVLALTSPSPGACVCVRVSEYPTKLTNGDQTPYSRGDARERRADAK